MEGKISESEWKKALTSIIEDLFEHQYEKMLSCLEKIPESEKSRSKQKMPQILIQHLGVEGSIREMERVLQEIPRNDDKVQDLLRPFVEKLKNKQQQDTNTGKKRNNVIESEDEDEAGEETEHSKAERKTKTDGKKRKYVSESEDDDDDGDQQKKNRQSDKENIYPSQCKSESWRITIRDLKESRYLGSKAITGKVVRKSGLRPYQTQNKEKKTLFHLGLADDTDCIKVTAYGKQRYEEIQEGRCYMFRDVIIEGSTVKVTRDSKVPKTSALKVPEDLELEAKMIIDPQKPVCSIAQAKKTYDNTEMSVEGTITEMTQAREVKTKHGRRRKVMQRDLYLKDDTDSIRISLWDDLAKECSASVGDSVRVTNVRTNHYMDTVSLTSTAASRVYKVDAAPVQTGTVEIIGIFKANKLETELEAVLNGDEDVMKTFVVASKLLAQTFNIRLEGDFEERLLDKIPLIGEAEIQGNKIIDIRNM